MTVSWGMMGTVWGKPMVQVLVRPQRHSWQLLAGSDSLTLCVLPPGLSQAHSVFGAVSGRDQDKFAATGLHAEASRLVSAPSIAEASLVLECRIAYRDRLKPEGFVAPYIAGHYHDDWHYLYMAEVLGIFGD
jgi:flavin reductase (DIM6/NTAB) family NADH-FMN oxidoreductase RutF